MILPSEEDITIGSNCTKCGSSPFYCNCEQLDPFKGTKQKITESTKNNGYSVYIPEDAKKETTWNDIIEAFDKFNYGVQESQLDFWEWLKANYKAPIKNKTNLNI